MQEQAQTPSHIGANVLRQLRTSGVLFGAHSNNQEPLILTAADRLDHIVALPDGALREAKFRFSLGQYSEELTLRVGTDTEPADIARAAVRAARASMRKRGFSEADLKHLQVEGGEWLGGRS